MTVRYTVRADVVDIRKDTPRKGERFLVDTNVWYWMTYPRASLLPHAQQPRHYQLTHYPRYIQSVRCLKGHLLCCGLCLAELAHVIERAERRIAGVQDRYAKEFRHNKPADRARVVTQVEAAWTQINQIAECADLHIDEATQVAALERFKAYPLDGYDVLIFKCMAQRGIRKIVTDDGDFATVDGLTVFTAREHIINSARRRGKLATR